MFNLFISVMDLMAIGVLGVCVTLVCLVLPTILIRELFSKG